MNLRKLPCIPLIPLISVCLALLGAIPASFAASAQEPPAPSAATLVEHHVEARGGAEALAAVDSLRLHGVEVFNGIETPFVITRKRPNLYRIELETERGPAILATDGKVVWRQGMRRDGSPAPEVLAGDAAATLLEEESDFDGVLVGFADKGHTLEWVGDGEVDGEAADHLRLTLASGRAQEWYLGREDGRLLQKTTPQNHRRGGPYERNRYFMEYQEVEGGLVLPFYWEQEDIQHVRAYTLERVEVNPTIDPALFAVPEVETEGETEGETQGGGE